MLRRWLAHLTLNWDALIQSFPLLNSFSSSAGVLPAAWFPGGELFGQWSGVVAERSVQWEEGQAQKRGTALREVGQDVCEVPVRDLCWYLCVQL